MSLFIAISHDKIVLSMRYISYHDASKFNLYLDKATTIVKVIIDLPEYNITFKSCIKIILKLYIALS